MASFVFTVSILLLYCVTAEAAGCKYDCSETTTCNLLGCFCNVAGTMKKCDPSQDCDPARGCTCLKPECECSPEIYCDSPEMCDKVEGKCKCGNKDSKPCRTGETCMLGTCYCDLENRVICSADEECKDKKCVCGDRGCVGLETCVKLKNAKPFCACGDMKRRCEVNEMCEFSAGTYSCTCGTKVCAYDERCKKVGTEKKCMCGNFECSDLETCVNSTKTKNPICLCGNRQCAENAVCSKSDAEYKCTCNGQDCYDPFGCTKYGECTENCKNNEGLCEKFPGDCFGEDAGFVRNVCSRTCRFCENLKYVDVPGVTCDENAEYCRNNSAFPEEALKCVRTCKIYGTPPDASK